MKELQEIGWIVPALLAAWAIVCTIATERRPAKEGAFSRRNQVVRALQNDPSLDEEETSEKIHQTDEKIMKKTGMDEVEWLLRFFIIGWVPSIRRRIRHLLHKPK